MPSVGQATTAQDLCGVATDPCVVDSAITVDDGSVIDLGHRRLEIVAGGVLRVGSGGMTVTAGEVSVRAGGSLVARGTSSLPGGSVSVTADSIEIAGKVDASGRPGGAIAIRSRGDLVVEGWLDANFLSSETDGGGIRLAGRGIAVSGDVSARGGREAYGGTVIIEAQENLVVSSALDVSGGDGGTVRLVAGAEGSMRVDPSATLLANATAGGGSGGSIDLTGPGEITIDGKIAASGRSGTEDTGGGDGGFISILAAGNIEVRADALLIDAAGGRPDGDGGSVTMTSTSGTVVLLADVAVFSLGIDSSGGSVDIEAGGRISLGAGIDARGGGFDADEVLITSDLGDVEIDAAADVDVSAGSGGGGGDLIVTAGGFAGPGAARLIVAGVLNCDGGRAEDGSAGDGGTVELNGRDEVQVLATVRAEGGSGDGDGGDVSIAAEGGPVTVNGMLSVRGNGNGGVGGDVGIEAAGVLRLSGDVDARGEGAGGGSIDLLAVGDVHLDGEILATASGPGIGGDVSIDSGGTVSFNNTVRTDAGDSAPFGGVAVATACTVLVQETGKLSSLGPGGQNVLIGRDVTVVLGDMLAGGKNEVRFGGEPPAVFGSATVEPPIRAVFDAAIEACSPAAGGTPTPTEAGGTGTLTPRPLPTATATPLPGACGGDCNADTAVTVNELVRGVNIALGLLPLNECLGFDLDANGAVTIGELIAAVNNALTGCGPALRVFLPPAPAERLLRVKH